MANWVKDVEILAEIAHEEPQGALSAYNISVSHRWTFLQRTVSDISEQFIPLEEALRNKLIPALTGKEVNETERRMIALPYRYGGLGIQNPVQTSDREYSTSVAITKGLSNMICAQDMDLSKLDRNEAKETKNTMKRERVAILKEETEEVAALLEETEIHTFRSAQEKGASSWLSALPIKSLGYVLNKQEFKDAIALRYGWQIKGTPRFCACGKENGVFHTMICSKGGYVAMRHNVVRDIEATLMKEVCKDVQTEPGLLPANEDEMRRGTNTALQARLDISARGVWSHSERTFFDVRITHPNTETNRGKTLSQIYQKNEKEKNNLYNERIINIEKALSPL